MFDKCPRQLVTHLEAAIHSISHASCSNILAEGLSLGSSCISLLMNSRSSFAISREEAISKGVRLSTNLVMIVSVSSLSSSARLV